jgi:hypothetical protein
MKVTGASQRQRKKYTGLEQTTEKNKDSTVIRRDSHSTVISQSSFGFVVHPRCLQDFLRNQPVFN